MIAGGIVIDCGWLCLLDALEYDGLVVAVAAIHTLEERNVPLLLDSEGHVVAEYERNLPPRSLGRRFFATQMSRGRFTYHSGVATGACRGALRRMRFDPSDVPYVAVAQHAGGGFYLTHESKHLEPTRMQRVLEACGVTIASIDTVRAALNLK